MKTILLSLTICFFLACDSGGGPAQNLDGFDTESCGNGVTLAIKKDGDGNLIEKGYMTGGRRNGMWMTYYTGKEAGKLKTVASYSNGNLNGPYFEMSNRGQIEQEVNYMNNEFDGKTVKYKFGRPTQIKTYKRNALDGVSIDYFSDGAIQKEVNFKDGKQHGIMKWYNQEGAITMQYEYKNGEKVSGGIVEKEAAE